MASNEHMSEARNSDFGESLSVFFDGEIDRDAARFVIRRLESDAEARAKLERMALIGACLRGELVSSRRPSLADRVAAGLAAEERDWRRRRSLWWRWPVGIAAAASVAAVVLLAGGPAPMPQSPVTGLAASPPVVSAGSRSDGRLPGTVPPPFVELRTASWMPGEHRSQVQSRWLLSTEPPAYLRLLKTDPLAPPLGQGAVPASLSRPLQAESPLEQDRRR